MKQKTLAKEFGKYVSLSILAMLGISFYILADTYFIADKMGTLGLASLNLIIPVYSVMIAIGLMLGMGAATKFAVYKVRGETEKGNVIFTTAMIIGISLGIMGFIVGNLFAGNIVKLLGADSETYELSKVYLRTVMNFMPFFILNSMMVPFVRNDGNPNLSMLATVTGSITNVIFDYIFIYIFDWGMFGAAFATGFSPIVGLCVLSFHFIRKKNTFKLKKAKIKIKNIITIISLGGSTFINEISNGIVVAVFNFLLLKLSDNTAVAAYGVIANLSIVAICIFNGLAQGAQPLMSHSYGSNERSNLKTLYKYSIINSLVISFILVAVTFIFTEQLVALFNSEGDKELAEIAYKGLRLYFLGFIFAGLNIVSASYLNSMEKPQKSFIISITRGLIAVLIFAFLLSAILDITGIWITFVTAEFTTFLLTFLFVHKNQKSLSK